MPLLSSCSHGAITLERGRNVTYPGCWNRCTDFHAARHLRSESDAFGSEGKTGNPGVLSRRLEPGLWRPDDALQRRYSRSSARTTRNYWAFRSTGCGAMLPSPVTVTCISRCSPISNPRATSGGNTAPTAPIAQARASASAHYLSSIDRASSRGAIALRSLSIPAPTEFLTPSKNSQIRQNPTANLRTPITLVEYGDYECSIVRWRIPWSTRCSGILAGGCGSSSVISP